MNDLYFRNQVHQAVDRMTKTAAEDPWLAQRIRAQVKGEEPVKKKISVSLIVVIALLILSLSAALAAGLGVFDKIYEGGYPDERLPVLENVSEPVGTTHTTGEGVTLEISKAYFEGDRVFVAYRLTGPLTYVELHEGAPEQEYEWDVTENLVMAGNFGSGNPEEQRMINFLDGSGQRWALSENSYVSDGLFLEDGTYADIIGGEEQFQEDGSILGWKECTIPEDRLEDTLTFMLAVNHARSVTFQDGTTLKQASERTSRTEVPFTLNRNESRTFLKGSAQTESYSVSVTLACGQVDIRGSLVMTCPEEWANAYEDWEWDGVTDVIWDWWVYRGDELVEDCAVQSVSGEGTTRVEFELLLPNLSDPGELKLVPVYRKTNAHPDEAIPVVPVT